MISKADLLAAMERECDIAVHLHGKVPPGGADFRFTAGQRSTLELVRYLSTVGLGMATAVVTSDWTHYTLLAKEAGGLAWERFPAAMERQKEGLRALLQGVSDTDLEERTFTQPWGATMALGPALLVLPYACLVAYRMQLFLHAKAAGNATLGTPDCWAGVDLSGT